MAKEVIHAIVLIHNWGDDAEILNVMKNNRHIISIFHVMGRHSYLIDVNFDTMEQLGSWITLMKSVKMNGQIPAVLSLKTQRVIDVHKQKDNFSLDDYLKMNKRHHFFVEIDNPHHDEAVLKILMESSIVYSVLHVQGEASYTIEIITGTYDDYREFLKKVKNISTIHHIETMEVISVQKYRNKLLDDKGNYIVPETDIREIYTL